MEKAFNKSFESAEILSLISLIYSGSVFPLCFLFRRWNIKYNGFVCSGLNWFMLEAFIMRSFGLFVVLTSSSDSGSVKSCFLEGPVQHSNPSLIPLFFKIKSFKMTNSPKSPTCSSSLSRFG